MRPAAVVRGDVWLATLDPTVGSEIPKTRPCVIVSPPDMHDYLRTVTVVPMTSGSHPAPYRIPLRFQRKDGLIRRPGAIDARTSGLTLAALREMFEI
jgi:mRNA interferase MazF